MTTASIGNPIENFSVETTDGPLNLHDLKNKTAILYFYPKDNTPGCIREGQDFRDNITEFERLNTVILGISRDSIASHEKFKAKQNFPFELISDQDEQLCNYFDVIKHKSMFGKKFLGIQRSTFLIDPNGILRQEWRKVKVNGHVQELLSAVKSW